MLARRLIDLRRIQAMSGRPCSFAWSVFLCQSHLDEYVVDCRQGATQLQRRCRVLIAAYHDLEPVLEKPRPHRPYREGLAEGIRRAASQVGLLLR
jgi:hypothetical protein